MLNKQKHEIVMAAILRGIYSNTSTSPILGFKGGTAAYFFEGLTRFSVDLDFDLFETDETTQKRVFETVKKSVSEQWEIKDAYIKYHTVFVLVSYGNDDHNVKIEINTKPTVPNVKDHYEIKKHMGISMLVAKKDYAFANKLLALTDRKKQAMRDIYDVWFFGKNLWDINAEIIHAQGKTMTEQLEACIPMIERVKDNEIMEGLGELIDEKQKIWVKKHLRAEAIFVVKNYLSALKK